MFERCKKLTSASFPTSLTEIGKRAFFMKSGPEGLEQILIPSSVHEIGEKAFVGNNVSEITLPGSLKNLGEYLFMECSRLNKVRVECETIPAFCFVKCSDLSELALSSNVKKLGENMINYCPNLQTITYEDSLENWQDSVTKGHNWDGKSGMEGSKSALAKVQCLDGYMEYKDDKWIEVKTNA